MSLRFAAFSLVLASSAHAQSFRSATVTPSVSDARCAPNRSAGQTFTVTNCALGELILFAYDALQEQVSGDRSLLNERYDVTADAGHAVTRPETKRMLQALLADRFKLRLRRETRQVPVYALLLADDGPKFQHTQNPSETGPKPVSSGPGQLTFQNTEMSDIVFALSRRIGDRMVVDQTGLKGRFDFDMGWYLKLGKPDSPSVSTAVRELGLKLDPRESAVDFYIVEHAEPPSEK